MNRSVLDDERVPLLGTRADKVEALLGGLISLVVVIAYVLVANFFDTTTTWIEGVSLWASLACVCLARTENVLTMPYGLVAVILLGWFLLDIDLVGQGWLQFIFYVPVQIVGWWAWCRGGKGRTELPVSRLSVRQWIVVVAVALLCWLTCWQIFN